MVIASIDYKNYHKKHNLNHIIIPALKRLINDKIIEDYNTLKCIRTAPLGNYIDYLVYRGKKISSLRVTGLTNLLSNAKNDCKKTNCGRCKHINFCDAIYSDTGKYLDEIKDLSIIKEVIF